MRKYKTFFKLQRRMISKTKSRFLSVLIIIFIGTAFFAGLRITPTVMNTATDHYLDQQNYADLTLIPTYGVTQDDIAAIKKIDGVQNVEGTYFFDALLINGQTQDGVVVYSQSEEFNKPYLVEGRLVESDDECLIDEQYALANGLQLGDVIQLENSQEKKEFKIVGISKDTRYLIYYKRGSNSYGSGTSKGFVILSAEAARPLSKNSDLVELLGSDEYYNELCISIRGAKDLMIFSDEYDELVNEVEADIEEVMTSRLNERYENLIADKKELLKEPLQQYEEGLASYEQGKMQFEIEVKQAEISLIEGRMQVLEGKKQLLEAQSQFTDGGIDISGEISNMQQDLNSLKDQLNDLKGKLDQPSEMPELPDIPKIPETPDTPEIDEPQRIKDLIDQINGKIDEMNVSLGDLSQLADGLMQLEAGKLTLEKAELELDVGEQTLALTKESTQKQLDEAKAKLDEAKVQIDEAQAQIDAIPKAEYYLLDQNMNEGLVSFASDSDRIGVLAQIFPLMFFLVAALVSLTTMTRMVEEQRSQSGTLRALGYSRWHVLFQYIVYAFMATIIGAVLGIFFGCYLFPAIIYGLYALMMYDVPVKMIYCMDRWIALEAILIAVVVTLVATMASCIKELLNVPAVLMRPKAPKIGKRILLEKIPQIWNHLNFNQKVTMRNIFRYKKRCLMSIIGIAGCTALIVTGFGVKYSISDMTLRQFNDLWIYDGTVVYTDEYRVEDADTLRDQLKKNEEINEVLFIHQSGVISSGNSDHAGVETNLVVPANLNRLNNYLTIRDKDSKEELTLNDESAIITSKLAELLDVGVGDKARFTYLDKTYEFVVGGIMENYIQHYIYMTPTYFTNILNTDYTVNACYFNMEESDKDIENGVGQAIMKLDEVSSVTFVNEIGGQFINQMDSINIVVWVLIISAGLLAFVVLYNLTNININERITEIATIKVLGFRNHEVYDYVFRENILLSIIATVLGLVAGVFLHHYIMSTVEVDYVMFVRTVRPISFVYSAVLTMFFTELIDRFMRRFLRKVDMITSLKSVE